jgi:hypothetical protein
MAEGMRKCGCCCAPTPEGEQEEDDGEDAAVVVVAPAVASAVVVVVAASAHRRTHRSAEADAKKRLPGDHARSRMSPRWPTHSRTGTEPK